MKTVKLKSMRIQNFGSIKDLSIDFGEKTLISGRNEVGKTTISDAYSWILTNKLANGSQADGIRPHDKNGIENDNAVISVLAVLEIDGEEKEFLKEQRKEFTQKTGKFKGNNNLYFINGVPKKEKEYKAYVEEKILEPDNLELCTNASALLNMDTKKRRAVIFDMVPDVTDADVATTDLRFANITKKLEDCTLDELIQSVRYQINGRGRGDRGLKGKQDELPARIDEVQRQVIDIAEYSLGISRLQTEIKELNRKDQELLSASKLYDDKSEAIMGLKFRQSEIARNENAGLTEKKEKLSARLAQLEADKKEAENTLRLAEMDLKHANMGIERHTADVKKAREDYSRWMSQQFDDSEIAVIESEVFNEDSLICPTCGQAFPVDKAEKIREDFEKNKALRIEGVKAAGRNYEEMKDREIQRVTESGNKATADLKEAKKAKEEAEQKIAELKKGISYLVLEIKEKNDILSGLPQSVDLSKSVEYWKITADIAKAEEELKKLNSGIELRREINRAGNEKVAEVSRLQTLISASQNAQERVEELKEEQRNVGQLLADCQMEFDLLREFQKTKCDMLSEAVNKMFSFVKWRLFKMNQDGEGYQEVCEPMIENEPYGRRLNHGSRALAELDICNTFQNIQNTSLPLFVDDFDGITENTMKKINQFDRQMIFLKATEGDLKVEILE